MSAHSIIKTLGYAGLIPFVIPAILVTFDIGDPAFATLVAETYAFGIICFLTGSWWGMAAAPGNRAVIMLSNVYFLVAFLILLLLQQWWSLTASILLAGIFGLEWSRSLFPVLSDSYRKLRAILTLVSSTSMFAIHLAG